MLAPTVIQEHRGNARLWHAASVGIALLSILFLASNAVEAAAGDREKLVRIAAVTAILCSVLVAIRYAWTLTNPGQLKISAEGVEQRLLWKRWRLPWSEIQENVVVRTVPESCVIHLYDGSTVRLVGWEADAQELKRGLDQHRQLFIKA